MRRVDAMVRRSVRIAAVFQPGRPDPRKYRVELRIGHAKAEMQDWKPLLVMVEIERQAVADVHGRERPDAGLRPRHAKQLREESRRGDAVLRRYDQVIERDRHAGFLP